MPCLIFFIGEICHNITYVACQYAAEHFNSMGTDAFIALHPGQLSRADTILFDKGVL